MTAQLIQFHIPYRTSEGEKVILRIYKDTNSHEDILMQSYDNHHWISVIALESNQCQYNYLIKNAQGSLELEKFGPRKLSVVPSGKQLFVNDFWRTGNRADAVFFSSAFRDIIFQRPTQSIPTPKLSSSNSLILTLHAGDIPKHFIPAVLGNIPGLGAWVFPKKLTIDLTGKWVTQLEISSTDVGIEYKYVLLDAESGHLVKWEDGDNRKLNLSFPAASEHAFVQNDEEFRKGNRDWKGAGIAIPVFSLRSEKGFGIGEFTDLQLMIDLAASMNMNMVQILPVNDTIAQKTWMDSYPYSAISVYALHPLYVNLESIGSFRKKKDHSDYIRDKEKLNALPTVDFTAVLERKMYYLRLLFEESKADLAKNAGFKAFLKSNAHWLNAYGAFCTLRDRNGTPDFNQWPEHFDYDAKSIASLIKKDKEFANEVLFYQFIQYHAHLQLSGARNYGKNKGVVLKGDLPIGIYRYSCDAWVAPELYNMNEQAGAPPDAYATLGQNWGFPTYNWSAMAKDGFEWWRQRMIKLSEYFDALRIDHILGFFRIWQIPLRHVQGTMGLFNPRLPLRREELMQYGLYGDLSHYTRPYIRKYFLQKIFGKDTQAIIDHFLDSNWEDSYVFKENFQDQRAILSEIQHNENPVFKKYKDQILSLMSEVLLIEEPGSNGAAFNPRITLQSTHLYQSLDETVRKNFDRLYIDYFFHRHDQFWKSQALWKLPALMEATNMFICGEDLGMIPASVPEVMQQLNIIPLEIQRMPKGPTPFGIPASYPYFSVCSPSCHDMSTIRGWWEGNTDVAQRFYNQYMGRPGKAPVKCELPIIELILRDHFHSSSMLAIFPIQDLLGIEERLRRSNPAEEQINEPSNPEHYWQYRLHLPLEQLLQEEAFIATIAEMVKQSGRAHFH